MIIEKQNGEPYNILFFDIETTPNLAWIWGKYEQNAIDFERTSHLLSFSAKFQGKKIITKGLIDYKGYVRNKEDDKALVRDLWHLLDKADIVVAHNGRAFDTKKANARFSFHKMGPPSPYQIVDTKEMSKRHFNFTSNSLNDIADYLGIGHKLETGGFELWKKCMAGDRSAWAKMKKYNAYDVVLLEKVYNRLLPWSKPHPNLSILMEGMVCPRCGSKKLQSRGDARGTMSTVYARFQCQTCGGWGRYNKKLRAIKEITRPL